jgi:hypothetical protein
MGFIDDVAAAVWAYSTRTVDGQAAPASDGSALDNIRYAIWTYSTRTVTGGGGIVGAGGIASAEALGTPAVQARLVASGIASSEAFGSPGVLARIGPAGIPSEESFGLPTVTVVSMGIVGAGGIASAEAVGRPRVGAPPVMAAPPSSIVSPGSGTEWNVPTPQQGLSHPFDRSPLGNSSLRDSPLRKKSPIGVRWPYGK